MEKIQIGTDLAPAAIGPYSQAIRAGDFVYTSGQLPTDPATGEFSGPDVGAQAAQCLKNLQAVLQEAGSDLYKVVKTLVFLTDMDDFAAMNEVYATYFPGVAPARSCVAVKALPKGARVEIEAVAICG